MQYAGARVFLAYDGTVEVLRGYVRPEDQQAAGFAAPDAATGPATRLDYSGSVVLDLTAHRTAALRLELARNSAVALAAVVHALVTGQRNADQSYRRTSALTVGFRTEDVARRMQDPSSSLALSAHDADLASWNERIPVAAADAWSWCLQQDTETLLAVLAVYSALSVEAVHSSDNRNDMPNRVHEEQLAHALALDMAQHWQPTPAFMARLSKAVMAAALAESGNPGLAAEVRLLSKTAAATKAAEALARAGWLPPVLRSPLADPALLDASGPVPEPDNDSEAAQNAA